MVWINNKYETLGSTSDTMDATSMTASQFGVFLNHAIPDSNSTQTRYTVNGVSSGSKYASRQSKIGMTDVLAVSQDEVIYDSGGETDDKFSVTYACDIAGEEKLFIGFGISRKEAGGGNAPTRSEVVWKYVTTSARVTSVRDDTSSQSGTYAVGSNLSAIGDGGVTQTDRESLTNVPSGTRFEETDTRKIYRYNTDVGLKASMGNLDDGINMTVGQYTGWFQHVGSGSALIGVKVSKIGLAIIKQSGANGTGVAGVWDSTDKPNSSDLVGSAKHVFASLNISSINQSYSPDKTFGTGGDFDTNSDGEYTLQEGDYIGFCILGASGQLNIKGSYAGDTFDGTATQLAYSNTAGNFTDQSPTDDLYLKLYATNGWLERGTAV